MTPDRPSPNDDPNAWKFLTLSWPSVSTYSLVLTLLKLLGYIGLMVFLGFAAMSTRSLKLAGLETGAIALAAALVGLVVDRYLWIPAIVALVVAGLAGYSVFALHPQHPSAGVALVGVVAAFGALFLDTTTITHPRPQREVGR